MQKFTGSIKWYSDIRDFGFIVRADDNREFFFHLNDCQNFCPMFGDKRQVEFEVGADGKNRPKAINVKTPEFKKFE